MPNRKEETEGNAMEPGTVLPIHRHRGSTVVRQAHQPIVVVLKGNLGRTSMMKPENWWKLW